MDNFKESVDNLRGGYNHCLNKWAMDENIQSELGLLCMISCLTARTGVCTASNAFLANVFNIHEKSISRKITKLKNAGYINISYVKRGCEIERRLITLTSNNIVPRRTKMLPDESQICYPTSHKSVTEKNISTNNISINNIEQKFVPPKLEEVEAYCRERNNYVDAKRFFDYYSAGNWKDKDGKPVKNWKQKMIANWERNATKPIEKKRNVDKGGLF